MFLINKYFEYAEHLGKGEGPWHNTFLAIYFTLTGLHGLHIVGGMVVMAYFLGPGAKMWKTGAGAVREPDRIHGVVLALRRPRVDLSVPGVISVVGRLKPDSTYVVDLVFVVAGFRRTGRTHDSDPAEIKKSVRSYMTVFAMLMVFTVITVAASRFHLAVPVAITVALIIAAMKGSMVAAVFMHLSHEKRWVYGTLLLTAVFFIGAAAPPVVHLARRPRDRQPLDRREAGG